MLLLFLEISFASDQIVKLIKLEGKTKDNGFRYPTLELKRRVAKIFDFYDAEYISGLTCWITYNGKKPLPSKVFFQNLIEDIKKLLIK